MKARAAWPAFEQNFMLFNRRRQPADAGTMMTPISSQFSVRVPNRN